MKRLLCLSLAFVLLFCTLPATAQAAETTTTVQYLEDGSYIVTEIQESLTRSQTKVASKSKTFYNINDVPQWKIVVTAEFIYDGSTCTCTYASGITNIYDTTEWAKVSDSASCYSNTGTYTARLKQMYLGLTLQTSDYSVTLSCDANGNFS